MTEPEGRALLIKKLLNKAEAAGTTEPEREALNAKALQLMLKWGIEDAMLTDADRLAEERIIQREFTTDVPKSFSYEYTKIGVQIAEALGCRGLLQARWENRGGKRTNLLVIGFESDVARVGELFHSLVRQCTLELGIWYARLGHRMYSGTEKFNAKRGFIAGYASGVKKKFADAKKAVMVDAAPGTDLVLVDRKARVTDWVDQNLRLGTSRARSYSETGYETGHAAGQRADLGGTKLGGDRRRIEG